MNNTELLQIIARDEDSSHQFKADVTNELSVAQEMIAFSNTIGGLLLIGVSDDGSISGLTRVDINRINNLISNAASQQIKPSINPLTRNYSFAEGLVMVVHIQPGLSKPYMDRNGVIWVKNGADKRKATSREEIQHSAMRKLLQDINLRFVPDAIETKLDDAIASALATSSQTNRIYSFIEHGGLFAAHNFLDWMKTKLNSGVYPLERGAHPKGEARRFGDMNMAEFHQATGIELSLVAADTSGSQLLILNHRTAPDCPVVWAVRMSMSVPLLWEEVVWQPEWGGYRDKDISGHTVGGIQGAPQPHQTTFLHPRGNLYL